MKPIYQRQLDFVGQVMRRNGLKKTSGEWKSRGKESMRTAKNEIFGHPVYMYRKDEVNRVTS